MNKISRRVVYAALGAAIVVGCSGGGGGFGSGTQQTSDPLVVDFPIAYVKRPVPLDDMGDPVEVTPRELVTFNGGAALYLRERASVSANEINVTDRAFVDVDGNVEPYDVQGVESDFDGRRLVFAMRAPQIENVAEDEQPTWNIWTYDLDTDTLSRVIQSDTTAEAGHDLSPTFLADGRIMFASTRQRQSKAKLLDEGKAQFTAFDEDRNEAAFTLHVMNDDGLDIHQVTFNQSHDQDPTLLSNGKIAFSRWDNSGPRDLISLYQMNPDGTQLEHLYGRHSHDTGPNGAQIEFMSPRELNDGRVLSVLRPPDPTAILGATLAAIDANDYVEHDQPTFMNQGALTEGQEALVPGVFFFDEPSPSGRYGTAFPLNDGTDRFLVSWSPCRLLEGFVDPNDPNFDPNAPPSEIVPCTDDNLAAGLPEAPPLFGLWVFDKADDTQQPVVLAEEGFIFSEAVVLADQPTPIHIPDGVPGIDLDLDMSNAGTGAIHIRSIYDFDGVDTADPDIATVADPAVTTADDRLARFVRIEKAVSLPDPNDLDVPNTAFGRIGSLRMREIVGYGEVHPDGSVKMQVPANVPLAVTVLNKDGQRISQRHNNWLQVRPGETIECTGCHTDDSQMPHGRLDAQAPTINPGGPFPNTDPLLPADPGETMAETFARINGVPEPDFDLTFIDVWTDPAVRTKDAPFVVSYGSLQTLSPVEPACELRWLASCRITIHYEDHIHPLWGVLRQLIDPANGQVLEDRTCTSCHTPVDAANMAQVPAADLDLTDGQSADEPDQFKSYRELLFNDNAQTVVNGVLVDLLVPVFDQNGNQVFETDQNGNLILDANGNPIPVLETVTVTRSMNATGALASPRFFSKFAAGGTHEGYLTASELKLISEWLDIGAQYYNDPFRVPQN
jgi:hypothetical protein